MLEIINDDFKQCCCAPVKCDMPCAINIEFSGFAGVWTHEGNGGYMYFDGECLDCEYVMGGANETARAARIFEGYEACAPGPVKYWPTSLQTNEAVCVQNPALLEFFPWLAGTPTEELWTYSFNPNQCGTFGIDIVSDFVSQQYEWSVEYPTANFQMFVPVNMVGAAFITQPTDLHNTFTLTRAPGWVKPVLLPTISRSTPPPAGQISANAQLLFDVYEQAPPSPNQIESGVEPWYDVRYSVDHRCDPRVFVEPGDKYSYLCFAALGIAPPKLQILRYSGGSTAELDFVISPAVGTGTGRATDTLWFVSQIVVVNKGVGASVGDLFVIDFYESPARGGEYRTVNQPQKIRVTAVDNNGGIVETEIVEVGNPPSPVLFGRILCHPNGVAMRGSHYSEGDVITWNCQAPSGLQLHGTCTTYQQAVAYVSEVDAEGGIIDWWMGASVNWWGCGWESHDGYEGSRGLYSQITLTEKCAIRYVGYAAVRAAYKPFRESWMQCGNSPTSSPTRCEIFPFPMEFLIAAVPTKLNIDITAPPEIKKYTTKKATRVTIKEPLGEGQPPKTTPLPQTDGDFFNAPKPFTVAHNGLHYIKGSEFLYLGTKWEVRVTVSCSFGLITAGGQTGGSVSLSGEADSIEDELNAASYSPLQDQWGTDYIVFTVEFFPPGHENPRTAVAKASEIAPNFSEELLDYALGNFFGIWKGFVYPESRQPGGVSQITIENAGAGYAFWDGDGKQWVQSTRSIEGAQVLITSAWDDLRWYLLNYELLDTYARAHAVVDLNTESESFGKITGIELDRAGYFYVLHDYDQMWFARFHWDFTIGWPDLMEPGFFGRVTYPQLEHRNGYYFGPAQLCEPFPPEVAGDAATLCPSGDFTEICKLAPNDYLWSFNYCPKDLLKTFEMVMKRGWIDYPNSPNTVPCCDPSGGLDTPYELLKYGCRYNAYSGSVVSGNQECYACCLEGSDDVYLAPHVWTGHVYENFGVGPITISVTPYDDGDHRREEDVF